MPKRTICIQNPAELTVEKQSLQVKLEMGTYRVPLEDIWVLILESSELQISSRALASLMDNGIGVMTCGRSHMPNGLCLPLGAHSRHALIVERQLAMSKPLRKQLWKRIVKQKILNQSRVLELIGEPSSKRLYAEYKAVASGDTTNRESVAAAEYFKRLIPDGTRRESGFGKCLDYAYAVLRAGIARSAVAGGWLVSRGIHHSSELNAFNLVDDLIEPFRPAADLIVYRVLDEKELSSQNKGELAAIFEYCVEVEGNTYTIQSAIDHMLETLSLAVREGNAERLALPKIIELQRASGEGR